MMIENVSQKSEFVQVCKDATVKAFKGIIKDEEIDHLLSFMQDDLAVPSKEKTPNPEEAKAELYTVAIYGYVKCTPTHLRYYFEANHWGLGLAAMATYGFMYTAYDKWDTFFKETRGYHAQGIAEAGGILQITWFNGKGTPVGQFNAAAGGIGVFEVGGKGKWKKKK